MKKKKKMKSLKKKKTKVIDGIKFIEVRTHGLHFRQRQISEKSWMTLTKLNICVFVCYIWLLVWILYNLPTLIWYRWLWNRLALYVVRIYKMLFLRFVTFCFKSYIHIKSIISGVLYHGGLQPFQFLDTMPTNIAFSNDKSFMSNMLAFFWLFICARYWKTISPT